MHRQVIALFLAVSGLTLAFRPARSQTGSEVKREESSTHTGSDGSVTPEHAAWRDYAGAADGAQLSALDQINRSNVSQLRVAWTYPTGDGSKYRFNPVVVDRTMYVP